jgi:hypothetical protein
MVDRFSSDYQLVADVTALCRKAEPNFPKLTASVPFEVASALSQLASIFISTHEGSTPPNQETAERLRSTEGWANVLIVQRWTDTASRPAQPSPPRWVPGAAPVRPASNAPGGPLAAPGPGFSAPLPPAPRYGGRRERKWRDLAPRRPERLPRMGKSRRTTPPGPGTSSPPDLGGSRKGTQPGSTGSRPRSQLEQAMAEAITPGRLVWNPPDTMPFAKPTRVEVRVAVSRDLDQELVEGLTGSAETRFEDLPTSPFMGVVLRGDGFDITSLSDRDQLVAEDGYATWEFDVRPSSRGVLKLQLCVSLRIPIAGRPDERQSVPVLERTVHVHVGVPKLAVQFAGRNWQWFVGTAVAAAGVAAGIWQG